MGCFAVTYEQLLPELRESYDRSAEQRDRKERAPWKIGERARFLSLLQAEGKRSLLEIGAGTGKDSEFFQDNGMDVTSTDLSPEHVRLCREKGLNASVRDFLNPGFPNSSFDAVYAMNCLLHVPRNEFPKILKVVCRLLKPSGLFYLGQWGGRDSEGVWPEDHHMPKRFFSFFSDEQLRQAAAGYFEVMQFKKISFGSEDDLHIQSMVVRKS
jgi:SAM-dependent methyltransferase